MRPAWIILGGVVWAVVVVALGKSLSRADRELVAGWDRWD